MIVSSYGDVVVNTAGQQLSIEPVAETTAPAAEEKSTDWSPLIDAFTSIGKSRQSQPGAQYAPTSSIPDWVWLAVPLAAGVLVLTIALASARGPNRRLAGYGRARARRARR